MLFATNFLYGYKKFYSLLLFYVRINANFAYIKLNLFLPKNSFFKTY